MGDAPHLSFNPQYHPFAGPWPGSGFTHFQQPFVSHRNNINAQSYIRSPYYPAFPTLQYALGTPLQYMTSSPPRNRGSGPLNPGPYDLSALGHTLPPVQQQRQATFSPTYRDFEVGNQQQQFLLSTQVQYGGLSVNAQHGQQYNHPQQAQLGQSFGSPVQQRLHHGNLSQRQDPNYHQSHPAHAGTQQAQRIQHMPTGFDQHSFRQVDPVQSGLQTGMLFNLQQGGAAATYSASQEVLGGFHAPETTSNNQSGLVRGPPRKPHQTGHAIWIGNLPPQTDLMSLVHHVCREAPGLESLFLISKSNCAFANFSDEVKCAAAQQKLHDSRFQSVRLVSRLRKSAVEGTTGSVVPTGPAAPLDKSMGLPDGISAQQEPSVGLQTEQQANQDLPAGPGGLKSAHKDKFFVLKSLTVEDLDLSVRTGIWATQSHNEEVLNQAFQSADNVYLIFSANKSGEYFGYARMISEINNDPAVAIEFAPKAQHISDVNLPKAIPTEAMGKAPRGRIIDDSARGTIFWEVERDETATAGLEDADTFVEETRAHLTGDDEGKAWGKPFKLEWLSTTRLPFYRCRGLRNPWNSNREIKIARDGTELEPTVARRLVGLFNQAQMPPPMANLGRSMPPMMMMMDYQQMQGPYM